MANKIENRVRANNAEIDSDLLHNSEIRNGEFVRYYGKKTEIVIPDNVGIIARGAFKGNHRLTRVVLGKSVSVIHPEAFRDCTNLKVITLPTGLRSIGESALLCGKL